MLMFLFITIVLLAAAYFVWRAHKEGRLDLRVLLRRVSTLLGLLTLGQGGAIIAYNQAPPSFQEQLPPTISGYLLVGMMLCGALTPVATSITQRWFSPKRVEP